MPDTGPVTPGPDFVEIFKTQSRVQRDSPITASLLRGAATDLRNEGPATQLVGEVVERLGRAGRILIADDLPGRLAAALHLRALQGDSPLTEIYPSAGGSGALHEVWPAARDEILADPTRVISAMLQPVLRSDPARVAMLDVAMAVIGRTSTLPLRLFDVGAGAGLLLAADHYRRTVYGESYGPDVSPVHIDEPWATPPDIDHSALPEVVQRRGCDSTRLDPGRPGDVRRLLAWAAPDQPAQQNRIVAACAVTASLSLQVDPLPASVWLPRQISWPRTDAHSVVWHSDLVLDLTSPERTEFATSLLGAGGRATATSPLTVCSFEPVGADDLLYRDPVGTGLRHGHGRIDPTWFELRLTTWPGGETRVLAHAEPTGTAARWAGSAAAPADPATAR